jgi:hypothetical protein
LHFFLFAETGKERTLSVKEFNQTKAVADHRLNLGLCRIWSTFLNIISAIAIEVNYERKHSRHILLYTLIKDHGIIFMFSSLHHQSLFSLLFLLVFIIAIPAYGQGGPPMITDDPFTPENGHFENNFAIQFTGTSSSKEIDIPAIDINYGYGDHIQLKIEMPMIKYLHDDDGSLTGSGNVKIGMKARFLDEEINGIAISTFPQYEFNNSYITEGSEAPQFFFLLKQQKHSGDFITPLILATLFMHQDRMNLHMVL